MIYVTGDIHADANRLSIECFPEQKEMNKDKNYFVYRFKNIHETIVYVGRTINLRNRFKQHSHLTNDVVKIEYIKCNTYADMVWKEIYYINYYKNKYATNIYAVYDGVTDIHLNDNWLEYDLDELYISDFDIVNYYNDIYDAVLHINKNYNYSKLINIYGNIKLNSIGDDKYAFSNMWFKRNKDVGQLRKNISNYYKNILNKMGCFDSNAIMWTSDEKSFDLIKGKGYTKGYVRPDIEFNEHFKYRYNLAYIINDFLDQKYIDILKENGITITKDQFSLYHMLAFIFKSDIYYGRPINLYIPSKRMRELLVKWIEEN